jgi:selenocysteine lyase/cysteine desulfurase
MDAYEEGRHRPEPRIGSQFTPGGYHAFDHRWSIPAAIDFRERIGVERIRTRVRELNTLVKTQLAQIPGVRVHTPLSEDLSAGITAFEVPGMSTREAKTRLLERNIIATVAPYPSALLRFTPGIINTEADVERGVQAVREIAAQPKRRRSTRKQSPARRQRTATR